MDLKKHVLLDGSILTELSWERRKTRKFILTECEHLKKAFHRDDHLKKLQSCGCIKKNKKSIMIGKKYGKLLVLEDLGKRRRLCLCDCGNKVDIHESNLYTGNTKSCGCIYDETRKTVNYKHGHSRIGSKSSTYSVWVNIKARCYIKSATSYIWYGARGITMCDSWKNSFESFLFDMGEKPDGHSIGRIDNTKGYFPENCRWETPKQQAQNRQQRQSNIKNKNCAFCKKIYHPKRNNSLYCTKSCFHQSYKKKDK